MCFFSFYLKPSLRKTQSFLILANLRFSVSRASPGSTSQHDLHLRNPLPMADSQKNVIRRGPFKRGRALKLNE